MSLICINIFELYILMTKIHGSESISGDLALDRGKGKQAKLPCLILKEVSVRRVNPVSWSKQNRFDKGIESHACLSKPVLLCLSFCLQMISVNYQIRETKQSMDLFAVKLLSTKLSLLNVPFRVRDFLRPL